MPQCFSSHNAPAHDPSVTARRWRIGAEDNASGINLPFKAAGGRAPRLCRSASTRTSTARSKFWQSYAVLLRTLGSFLLALEISVFATLSFTFKTKTLRGNESTGTFPFKRSLVEDITDGLCICRNIVAGRRCGYTAIRIPLLFFEYNKYKEVSGIALPQEARRSVLLLLDVDRTLQEVLVEMR